MEGRKGGGKREGEQRDSGHRELEKRSWVSVTGVYNWLDCRVLIWFSFCLPSERDVSRLAEGRENARKYLLFQILSVIYITPFNRHNNNHGLNEFALTCVCAYERISFIFGRITGSDNRGRDA